MCSKVGKWSQDMTRRCVARRALMVLAILIAAGAGLLPAQQVHRNKFETAQPFWVKGGFDAPYEIGVHAITDQGAHDGQRCEYLQLQVKQGNFIYYQYGTGKAPISDELIASVYLKANRPGIQIMARVVLPNERDPSNLDA